MISMGNEKVGESFNLPNRTASERRLQPDTVLYIFKKV